MKRFKRKERAIALAQSRNSQTPVKENTFDISNIATNQGSNVYESQPISQGSKLYA